MPHSCSHTELSFRPTKDAPGSNYERAKKKHLDAAKKLEAAAQQMNDEGEYLKMLRHVEKSLEVRCKVLDWTNDEVTLPIS